MITLAQKSVITVAHILVIKHSDAIDALNDTTTDAYATLAIQPSEPCYVVFDVVNAQTKGGFENRVYSDLNAFKALQPIKYSTAKTTYVPAASKVEASTPEEVAGLQWDSYAQQCTESYKMLLLQAESYSADKETTLGHAYVSNIRIYKTLDDLPQEYKLNLKVEFPEGSSYVKYRVKSPNGQDYLPGPSDVEAGPSNNTYSKQFSQTLPLYSNLYDCKISASEGYEERLSIEGWDLASDKGEPIASKDKADLGTQKLTRSINYVAKARTSLYAAEPAFVGLYSKSDDSDPFEPIPMDDAGPVYSLTEYGPGAFWWATFRYGTPQDTFKIEFKDPEGSATTTKLMVNGEETSPETDPSDPSKHFYIATPYQDDINIEVYTEEPGCARNSYYVHLIPTLDFDDSYNSAYCDPDMVGYKDGTIENNYYAYYDPHRTYIGDTSYSDTWLFQKDSYNVDPEHPIIHRSSPNTDFYTEIYFTPKQDGLFGLDFRLSGGDDFDFEVSVNGIRRYQYTEGDYPNGIGWQHLDIPFSYVEDSSFPDIEIEFSADDKSAYAEISNVSFNTDLHKLNVKTEGTGTGSVKVNGEAPKAEGYYTATVLTLEPTPTEGSVFSGWYDAEGNLESTVSDYTFRIMDERSITAKFTKVEASTVALIRDQPYTSLEDALEAAKPGDVVQLVNDYTLAKDATVPADVTLIVPCQAGDLGYRTTGYNYDSPTTDIAENKAYRTLTVPERLTLTVDGTLMVNSISGYPKAGAGSADHEGVNGPHGAVDLAGNIVVGSTGYLDNFGFITGSGTITAEPGGTVSDLFIVLNWRGGTQALEMYSNDIYPMNEYQQQNIQCKLVIEDGATYTGFVKMFANSIYYYTRFNQIGEENALINLADGATATKTYTAPAGGEKSGRERLALSGGATFGAATMELSGIDLTTADYVYPLNGICDFVFESGTYTFANSFKFLTGTTLAAINGAHLVVDKDAKVVLYDEFTDVENTGNSQYPKRDASTLTLDETSSLTNDGAFDGTVVTSADNIHAGSSGTCQWDVKTREANGYQNDFVEHETELNLQRENYTWSFDPAEGPGQDIVWTGADEFAVKQQVERYEQMEASGETDGWTQENIDAVEKAIADAKEALPQPKTEAGEAKVKELAQAINDAIQHAQENLKQFTLAFDPVGGTFADDETVAEDGTVKRTVTYGDAIGATPVATKEGWVLQGWQVNGSTVEATTLVKGDIANAAKDGVILVKALWGVGDAAKITYELGEGGEWAPGDSDFPTKHGEHDVTTETFMLPTPVKKGYTFVGWERNNDGDPQMNAVVEKGSVGAITFTAKWQVNTYTLTWELSEGQAFRTDRLDFGASVVAPTDMVREGYGLTGWQTIAADGAATAGAPVTMPDHDVTVRASWEDYLSLLQGMEEKLADPETLSDEDLQKAQGYYEKLSAEQASQYDARTLVGALVEKAIPTVNATLAKGYSGYTDIAELSVDSDASGRTIIRVEITNPSTKAKAMLNVKFLEELFGAEEVTTLTIGDQVLGKANSSQFNIMLAVAQETIAGKKEGIPGEAQAFRKWLIENQDSLDIDVLDGTNVAVTLGTKASGGPTYAVYFYCSDKAESVDVNALKTIVFDSNGGSAVPDIKKEEGARITEPPAPVKPGYTFGGWFETDPAEAAPAPAPISLFDLFEENLESEFEFTTMPAEQKTVLHALWLENDYTITYSAGEGATGDAPEATTQGFDDPVTLPECSATREGYDFGGWQAPDGTIYAQGKQVSGLSKDPEGEVALTATWKPKGVEVTFSPGEGATLNASDSKRTLTFGEAYGKLPVPYKLGYTFAGWFMEDGTTRVGAETPVATATAHTLSAKWNENGDVDYDVQIFKQALDGTYDESSPSETRAGKAKEGANVTAEDVGYEGFVYDSEKSKATASGRVTASPKLVLKLYFKRAEYSVTWDLSEGPADVEGMKTQTKTYPYEAPVVPPVALEAGQKFTSKSGIYTFTGWEPTLDANLTATSAINHVTYKAKFDASFAASTSDGKTWGTLQDALDHAKETADKLVTLPAGTTKLAESATIPTGVTLLVPYKAHDTGYADNYEHQPFNPDNMDEKGSPTATEAESPYATLEVSPSATLTVEGTLLVNSLSGRRATTGYVQDITGGWGSIALDGAVVVSAGGNFENFGHVRGKGSVTCERGGAVGDYFTVQHWRGGSQALTMYSFAIYPYSEYDCHAIEVPVTVKAGGTLNGLVKMYADGAYYSTRFPLVDARNGLIRQGAGEVTRTYDPDTKREAWAVSGGATFSRSTLNIVGTDLTTGDFLYPIDGDMDLTLKGGTFAFAEDYKLMPGATITAEGAHIQVAAGKTLVLYAPFGDAALFPAGSSAAGTGYPDGRGAAVLSLDATSSLMNDGTFAGKIETAGPNVQGAKDAKWEATTLEANGYYTSHKGDETRTIAHSLTMDAGAHTWRHSRSGRILWDGEPDEPIQSAIDENMGASSGSMIGSPEVSYEISVTEPKDGKATWTIDLSEKGLEESASTLGYEIMEEFLKAAHDNSDLIESVSTVTGEDPELTYKAKDELKSWPRLFAQKLGLVKATAPEYEAMAAGPKVSDLVGRHCQLLVTSVKEPGMEAPATITYDLVFTCSGKADPYAGLIPIYRLYNPYDGQHLLTPSKDEYERLSGMGWTKEGVSSYQREVELEGATTLASGLVPARDDVVYRLYNPYNGDHLYASSIAEVNALNRSGWDLEGPIFESADPDAEGATPVYRLFNPYMTRNGGLGSHLYTASEAEYEDLGAAGWKQERACWWAAALPK